MRHQRLMQILLAIALIVGFLPPTSAPVSADHCGDLEQLVAQLTAETEALAEELRRAEVRLDEKSRILLEHFEYWTNNAARLQDGTLANEAMLEMIAWGGENFVVGLVPGAVIALLAPTYIPAEVAAILGAGITTYQMIQIWQQMGAITGELLALGNGTLDAFTEARAFADQNNLPKLKSMIDLAERVMDLSPIQQVYDDWFNAAMNVESLAGTLEYERAVLQLAADELDRCVQEDLSPAGLWMNDDGHVVEIVIEAESGVASAVYQTNDDASCPHGDRRPEYLQGVLTGDTWEGTMWRCTRLEELVVDCGLSSVWSTSFTATVSSSTISGTYRTEWYWNEYDEDNPDGCHWVRDSSGDTDEEFSLTRVSYPSEEPAP